MGFFDRRKKAAPAAQETSRPLDVAYDFLPENMHLFAEDMVGLAASISGVILDYTPASLEGVDSILHRLGEQGNTEQQIAKTLIGFGAYVGEVIVRDVGGRWKDVTGDKLGEMLGPFPMIVETTSGVIWNPIGKCFKRLTDPSDNLPFFYEGVVEKESPRGA